MNNTKIELSDIVSNELYSKQRKEKRTEMIKLKKYRRIDVGPVISLYFENKETMIYQIQEMALTENINPEDLKNEIDAYNPLVPQGEELVATLMIEIDDVIRRKNFLARLGGIEQKVKIIIGKEIIYAKAEEDIDRTTADGKASSVHFLHFYFTQNLIKKFKTSDKIIQVGIDHEHYGHMAILSKNSLDALSKDFI